MELSASSAHVTHYYYYLLDEATLSSLNQVREAWLIIHCSCVTTFSQRPSIPLLTPGYLIFCLLS